MNHQADSLIQVVIPTWNGKELLTACLHSLGQQTVTPAEITVVDNGSSDGTGEYLRRHHPGVQLLSMQKNKGFSAAVNSGIRAGKAPLVFLLNNDTELAPDCLERLQAAAAEHRHAACFAPKMLSHAQRHILDGAGDGYLRGGAGYRLGTMERDSGRYDRPGPVFGPCAGAALYRRELFSAVGMFDEDFFAYLEDVDLNLRINRAGLTCRYVPAAVVFHVGSATTGSRINPFTVKLSTRNSFYVLLKNYSPALFLRLLPVILIYQFFWLLFALKKGQIIPYLAGLVQVLPRIPAMRRKYRGFRNREQLDDRQFRHCLQQAEKEVIASIMNRRREKGKGNGLLRLYGRIFLG